MTYIKHKIFIPAYSVLIVLYLLLGVAACTRMQSEPAQTENSPSMVPTDENTVIDAGKRIGKISIGMPAEELSFLGDPDLADSAMGKSWLTWYSKNSHAVSGKYELNIFTSYSDPQLTHKQVRCARVTSPDFRTANGISTNIDSSAIFKLNPKLRFVGTYTEKRSLPPIAVYEDDVSGIAIELDRSTQKTSAVIIFSPNRGLMPDYGYFRPDLKRG
ncbi:hypothetical protein [Flavobacterium silvaticum]|uniref:Lipoprotein n=1 Tax=Flavobacterium silvaticum TaxID=1852020 RepID=A0A972FN84_9FLAO|nr:hypothetical protein [Flavobacterium silvaticum]NMH29146.1 hypothetical protein [Flavobacterium silvaticum]